MKNLVFSCALWLSATFVYAQNADSLVFSKGNIVRANQILSKKEAFEVLGSNPLSAKELEKAKNNNIGSSVLGGIGGFGLGYGLVDILFKREQGYYIAGGGLAFALLGIPFSVAANKRYKNSVELYNKGLKPNSSYLKPVLLPSSNGIGLCLKF